LILVFDPKPFIRTFEGLTEELLRMKRKLQNKLEDQEDQLTASESSKRRAFKEFNDTFDVYLIYLGRIKVFRIAK
jgi:exocyst complex component 5